MTLLLAAVAVPINTVFGITCALLIARNEFPGKLIMTSMLDLPFSISPVVTGGHHFRVISRQAAAASAGCLACLCQLAGFHSRQLNLAFSAVHC